MSKIINFNSEARTKLKRGIDLLADSVKVTLGPKGRNVIIQQPYGAPHITKDGVSVAREIELEDPFENAGAQLVKSVASKTCDDAGDGTTTSTVLTQAIISEGIKSIEAGINPVDLKKGIDIAVKAITDYIRKSAVLVGDDFDKIKQVATISANNDPYIGELITEAFRKVSKNGVITIEEAKSSETSISVVEGMQFDRGFASPYFVTNNETSTCEFESPLILTYYGKIVDVKELLHILEAVLSTARPLVIITDDIDSEALSTFVINKVKNNFKLCVVKAPGYGEEKREYLTDISVATGATLITNELKNQLSSANIGMLGSAEKIIITKDNTTIINGNGIPEIIKVRVEELKKKLSETEDASLRNRLAKLSGGVAVLYVGAASEVEMKEKKDRVEDALCATRAAIEEGIVPGGGVAYIRALQEISTLRGNTEDEQAGIRIALKAITAPLRQIAINAGKEPGVIEAECLDGDGDWGYNAKDEVFTNLFSAGIIDPAKVTRVALENAASIASLVLTAGCVICDKVNNA